MARPNQTTQRRKQLIPVVARTFAELGYRRATTAELARRCDVQENILYRLWPDKKAMFIAAIDYVYDLSVMLWQRLLREGDGQSSTAQRLLAYESQHHGEFGHYRIVFAGLSETDDPEIRAALARMYKRYKRFVQRQIAAHRGEEDGPLPTAALTAWAVVGLGTVANIVRELELLSERQRVSLIGDVGRFLLDGAAQ